MLYIEDLHAGHAGGTHLHAVHLSAAAGSIHAVVGHNGAGKTTLLHTIAGLIRPITGRIVLCGQDLTKTPAHQRSRAGVGYVPQGARVFAHLTVDEHLAIAYRRGANGRPEWTPSRVLDLMPQLNSRRRHRGNQLSGGEQQMLAIARALLTQPRLLLCDEPTDGLAPTIATQITDVLTALAADGLTILLATPQPDHAATAADHVTVLTAGRTASCAVSADAAQPVPTPSAAPQPRRAGLPVWADLIPEPHICRFHATGDSL